MRLAGRLVAGIPLVPLALACAAPAPEAARSGPVPEWTLRRGLVLGSPDDPVHGFSDVSRVLVDDDRVYVLMQQEGAIRVFTREGEFVRDVGGRGEGPGELRAPGLMGWGAPGTIWVGDMSLRRFAFFDVATGGAATMPVRLHASEARLGRRLVPAVALASGRVAALAVPPDDTPVRTLLVLDTAGVVRDTLAELSTRLSATITVGLAAHSAVMMFHPVAAYDLWEFAPDGSSVAIVDRGSWTGAGPAEFAVTRVSSAGDTLFHRRLPYEPRPVPAAYYDERINESLEDSDIVNRRRFAAAIREFFERRRYFPPVTKVRSGSDGTTWLAGRDEDGERTWLVLDASGAGIGRFRLPAASRLSTASRAEAWVVERDALDIPYVVRYEILR